LFIRSSENSGRLSELVIGANLGLTTSDHTSALFDGYRPGASISLGAAEYNPKLNWSSATMLPMMGKQSGILLGDKRIMTNDIFAPDLLINN
ncbi:MAG: hypothetical protein JRH20_32355, partial [Deltaproteobacteria bacterium]|nr:hypothetical protein [Deltaproteobacteria bacterium]